MNDLVERSEQAIKPIAPTVEPPKPLAAGQGEGTPPPNKPVSAPMDEDHPDHFVTTPEEREGVLAKVKQILGLS